jgi:hypothetical protein
MLKRLVVLFASLAVASQLSAQMLITDRAPASGTAQYLNLPAGTAGFLADDFQVGAANEDWVIDHIRLWVVSDPKVTSAHGAGELFTKITLFGGIAPEPSTPGQVDCDCHNLPALRTAFLGHSGASFHTPGSSLTLLRQADGPDFWQIDFEDLKWSVPGAKAIQFGVLADARRGGATSGFYYVGSVGDSGQHLRVFSSAGKFENALSEKDPGRVNIQVWGHLLARVSIRLAGDKLAVTLLGQPALEGSQVDPASLHFGPKGVTPEGANIVAHGDQSDLAVYIRPADAGIEPKSINACLRGQRLDGAPFEGCDLLPH